MNYITITSEDYLKLNNPIFISQTCADDNGDYIMRFKCEGKFYEILCNIFK